MARARRRGGRTEGGAEEQEGGKSKEYRRGTDRDGAAVPGERLWEPPRRKQLIALVLLPSVPMQRQQRTSYSGAPAAGLGQGRGAQEEVLEEDEADARGGGTPLGV